MNLAQRRSNGEGASGELNRQAAGEFSIGSGSLRLRTTNLLDRVYPMVLEVK